MLCILYLKHNHISSNTYIIMRILFLIAIFIFYYGYYTQQYCFDPDISVRNIYQSIVHCLASVAHLCLMIS